MFATARRLLASAVPWSCAAVLLAACGPKIVAPPEPPLSVRRGDEAFHYQEYSAAINNYRSYLDQTENGAYTVRAFYKSALAAYRLGRYHDALATLDELEQRYPRAHWVQVDALRGDAEHSLGNAMQALQAWDAGWGYANAVEQEKLRQRILLTAKDLDTVELARARRLVTESDVVELLDHELAKRQGPRHTKTAAQSEAELEEMATGEPPATVTTGANRIPPPSKVTAGPPPTSKVAAGPPPSSKVAAELPPAKPAEPPHSAPAAPPPRATGPQTSASPADVWPQYDQGPSAAVSSEHAVQSAPKIGCLLPLTGAGANFGQQALRGLRLALGDHGPTLVLKDVGSSSAVALTAFDDLSRDPSILAVVGPLRSDYAETVAPEAERSRLPLFLLSQRDGLDTPYVMQVGLTRSRQVGTLLEYATTKARLRRFAVLYPDDPFGKEFVSAFQTEAQLRGAEVVGTEAYPPGEAGLSRKAGTLRKWRDANDLQAIFLPDGVTPATRLAKFLQREMPDVTLLGTYGWEALATPAEGAELNGVLFTDAFYADSTRPATRDFVSRFTAAYGNPPGVLEAQAYDAGLLVKRALDAGARSRSEVMERLRTAGSLDGATGDLQVTPAGLQRSPFLLQVYDGKLQEVDTREG